MTSDLTMLGKSINLKKKNHDKINIFKKVWDLSGKRKRRVLLIEKL